MNTIAGLSNPRAAPAVEQTPHRPRIGVLGLMRGQIVFSLTVMVLFLGGFGAWAGLAPLSAGAIAHGLVSPEGTVRAIQHLEGGIISVLHVREGQMVGKGDPLVTLQSVRAEASYEAQGNERRRLLVVRARLLVQMTGESEVPIPQEVLDASSTDLAAFVDAQLRLFESRRISLTQQQAIYSRQEEQLGSEIRAINAQNSGLKVQLRLINEELADKEGLAEQQLVSRSVVQALQRQQATLVSEIAANDARIARAEQSIEEVALSSLQVRVGFEDQVAEELSQVNNQIARLDEELRAADDVLQRTRILSPVSGIVQNLLTETPGGVIAPGERIMDIVPVDEQMVVIAQLAPRDIDAVRTGMKAHLTLLPFASRNALPLNGTVTQISADSTQDQRTGQWYYEVQITVPTEELALHEGMYMSPGMPADVTVVTGERTMLQYLMEPILRSFQMAFVQT